MKMFNLRFLLVAFLLVGLVFTACEDTGTDPIDDTERPQAPSQLRASTINENSIRLRWNPTPSESHAKFEGYVIYIDGVKHSDLVSKTQPFTVTGLTAGQVYDFNLKAKFTNGLESVTAANVRWSPAYRFTRITGQPIRIYESASTQFGSGLQIYDPGTGGPKILTVSNKAQWNLGLYTGDAGKAIFGSASFLYTAQGPSDFPAEISANFYDGTESLDDVYDSQALNSGDFYELTLDLNDASIIGAGSVVFITRIKDSNNDYNYAKVFIKRHPGGNFLAGTAPNRYIEVEISYQKEKNIPYAKTMP